MADHAALIRGEATLPGLLRERARERPDQVALREKVQGVWRGRTWAQYYRDARRVAHGLTRLGLTRGDRIVIGSEDVPEWFYADLGAQMIGVHVVGIYPTNPWPEVQYIAGYCRAKLAIAGDQEQTDKFLDALANANEEGNGLPHLQHLFCVDMKGLRRYRDGRLMSFAGLLERGRRFQADRAGADAELDRLIDEAANG